MAFELERRAHVIAPIFLKGTLSMNLKRRTLIGSSFGLAGTSIGSKLFARQATPEATPAATQPTGVLTLNGDLAHSDVGFIARHMVVGRVRGRFNAYTAEIVFDQDAVENSSVTATIDTTSIDTKIQDRDDHLMSADFLDVENYPEITFVSTSVVPAGNNAMTVTGDLTIKDVTQSVDLNVVYNGWSYDAEMTGHNYGWVAETTISLTSFGVDWNQPIVSGGFMIGDELTIQILMEAHPAG